MVAYESVWSKSFALSAFLHSGQEREIIDCAITLVYVQGRAEEWRKRRLRASPFSRARVFRCSDEGNKESRRLPHSLLIPILTTSVIERKTDAMATSPFCLLGPIHLSWVRALFSQVPSSCAERRVCHILRIKLPPKIDNR